MIGTGLGSPLRWAFGNSSCQSFDTKKDSIYFAEALIRKLDHVCVRFVSGRSIKEKSETQLWNQSACAFNLVLPFLSEE